MRADLRKRLVFGAVGIALLVGGCRLFVDLDGIEGSGASNPDGSSADGPAGMDATADGAADGPAVDAADGGDSGDGGGDAGCARFTTGTPMVQVGSFCIDKTEVTNTQYAAFLASKGADTSGQPPECAWNNTYDTNAACPLDALNKGTYPVNGVDWCDAVAYCKWAGKRLCGKVGGGGLMTSSLSTVQDPTQSEWMAACSRNGASIYPYGGLTFDGGSCAGGERGGGVTTAPVGSFPGCEGGYAGLFDMAGNIHEWANECHAYDGGVADQCWFRGGSYHDLNDSCQMGYDLPRDYVDSLCDIGLRCCADP